MAFADEVKTYCRAEDDITGFVNAAEAYLTNAGIAVQETNALYGLAVKILVSYWYDNRLPAGKIDAQPYGLAGIILQLQNQVVT